MSEIYLNKFEKEKRVIELHLAGKTIREIAKEVHMSFTPISNIIKACERKKELQAKREESNQSNHPKKLSISSQAFILFKEGKQIDEVKVLLDIPYKLAIGYWSAYLESIRMFEAFEFYQENSYDMPTFLRINNFLKLNNVYGKDIVNVLKTANSVINLNQTILNLKGEIERLKQTKYNYSLNQNTMKNLRPVPLGPLPRFYYNY